MTKLTDQAINDRLHYIKGWNWNFMAKGLNREDRLIELMKQLDILRSDVRHEVSRMVKHKITAKAVEMELAEQQKPVAGLLSNLG